MKFVWMCVYVSRVGSEPWSPTGETNIWSIDRENFSSWATRILKSQAGIPLHETMNLCQAHYIRSLWPPPPRETVQSWTPLSERSEPRSPTGETNVLIIRPKGNYLLVLGWHRFWSPSRATSSLDHKPDSCPLCVCVCVIWGMLQYLTPDLYRALSSKEDWLG